MTTACIFTIGTEITDGQITDRNSQWLSEQLTEMGVSVQFHCSLPDNTKLITDILTKLHPSTKLIFFCGGLGPTSDDLTRTAVSEYFSLPLHLDLPAWNYIQEKLSSRQVTLREKHKQQAMIPQGALALQNNAGVAPGIFFQHESKMIFALPGPPPELQTIWHEHVVPRLQELNIETTEILYKWMCTGIPESELAHITEEFFKQQGLSVRIGYRIQKPSVEVKVWLKKEQPEQHTLVRQFELLIKKYLSN